MTTVAPVWVSDGFIPISTLTSQCIGINVESVGMEYTDAGLKIVGTLVPRSPRAYMKACIHDKYRQYKNLDNFGSTYNHSYGRYEKIIINPPATIVIWNDGTKTVVKATENDIYDPEKGVALCFFKKYFNALYRQVLKDANEVYKNKLEEDAELNNSEMAAKLLKGFTDSLTEVTNKARKLILGDEKKEDGGNE